MLHHFPSLVVLILAFLFLEELKAFALALCFKRLEIG